jgi:hypothetical protein
MAQITALDARAHLDALELLNSRIEDGIGFYGKVQTDRGEVATVEFDTELNTHVITDVE